MSPVSPTYALERWDARTTSWIVVSLHTTRAEARAQAWSLRLPHTRVREVGSAPCG